MNKILLFGCATIAALVLISVAGVAQRHGGWRHYGSSQMHDEGMHMSACKDDVDKFCKDVSPGGGRIWACLKSHEAELSKPCTEHVAATRERGVGFSQACKADAEKFCKGIPQGKGRVASCLKSHEAELSEPCKAYFTKK
jgi:hypothetical protein